MSGINHLYDIYKKKGEDFLSELFSSKVTINEKMDGSSFSFEKTKDGRFNFYKRDQRRPITMVDRTLMKYYEKPIQFIETLPQHVLDEIPVGWRFGTEYFSSINPQDIVYDELPKNNLILSYIQKRNQIGEVIETVHDQEILDLWADILGISRPPIYFQGTLNDDQKRQILDFINTPLSDLVQEFKTRSFVKYILGVLNPELTKSTLNKDLDKPIEGIVFRFDRGGDQDPIVAKMIDPVFIEIAKGKEPLKREKKPNDMLSIIMLDVMNFILNKGLKSFSVDGKNEDERYISFISDVFVKFLEENSSRYQGMDLNEPDHLKREEFKLNTDLLKSRATRKWIEEDETFEGLFKLILNSFRKIKKKPGGIVSQDMLEQFNILVKDIESHVRPPEPKMDNTILEFSDFYSFKKKYIAEKIDYLTEDEDENSASDKFINAIETIEDETPKSVPQENRNNVNLFIGSFQPFDNLDMKAIKDLKQKDGNDVVICIIHPGFNQDDRYPISLETVEKMIDEVKSSTDGIGHIIRIKKPLLTNALEKCIEMDLSIQNIGCESSESENFTKQLEYFKNLNKKIGDVKISKYDTSYRDSHLINNVIANGDYTEFKKLVPSCISVNYFDKIRQEVTPSVEPS
jgi:hypothetical protein